MSAYSITYQSTSSTGFFKLFHHLKKKIKIVTHAFTKHNSIQYLFKKPTTILEGQCHQSSFYKANLAHYDERYTLYAALPHFLAILKLNFCPVSTTRREHNKNSLKKFATTKETSTCDSGKYQTCQYDVTFSTIQKNSPLLNLTEFPTVFEQIV